MTHTVGIAEMKIATDPDDELITYALGSCLGITAHDPIACVGGLLHVMLPLSTIDQKKASEQPLMFVDTGVPQLFIECYKAGAKKNHMIVKVAGGSHTPDSENDDMFQIGKRNFIMLRKLLWKNGVMIKSHDVGGTVSRTMSMSISTGDVSLRILGQTSTL